MTKEEYALRLQTKQWKEFAHACKIKMDKQCQMCGHISLDESKLHVHHMSYAMIDDKNEYKVLILLCEDCHDRFHKKSKAASKGCDRDYLELHLAKTLMKSGKDVSFFLNSGNSVVLKWKLNPLKMDGIRMCYDEKCLKANNWTPDKIKKDCEFIHRLLNKEDIPGKIITETLDIPRSPSPKKWRKKLFKYINDYSYKFKID